MAKPLTPQEIDAICLELRNKDLVYAQRLDSLQESFLSRNPRIRNFQDFKIVEDMKRTMIGLHTSTVALVREDDDEKMIPKAEQEASKRLKAIRKEVVH